MLRRLAVMGTVLRAATQKRRCRLLVWVTGGSPVWLECARSCASPRRRSAAPPAARTSAPPHAAAADCGRAGAAAAAGRVVGSAAITTATHAAALTDHPAPPPSRLRPPVASCTSRDGREGTPQRTAHAPAPAARARASRSRCHTQPLPNAECAPLPTRAAPRPRLAPRRRDAPSCAAAADGGRRAVSAPRRAQRRREHSFPALRSAPWPRVGPVRCCARSPWRRAPPRRAPPRCASPP